MDAVAIFSTLGERLRVPPVAPNTQNRAQCWGKRHIAQIPCLSSQPKDPLVSRTGPRNLGGFATAHNRIECIAIQVAYRRRPL